MNKRDIIEAIIDKSDKRRHDKALTLLLYGEDTGRAGGSFMYKKVKEDPILSIPFILQDLIRKMFSKIRFEDAYSVFATGFQMHLDGLSSEMLYGVDDLKKWIVKVAKNYAINHLEEIQAFGIGVDVSFDENRVADDASIENSLNCLGVCCYLMLPPEQIAERMAHLEPVAMRLEVKEGKNNCLLINDSYNSDLTSLELALDFQYRRSQDKQLKRTLILSDILETGKKAHMLYGQVAQLLKSKNIERIIGVGEEISSCADEFNMEKSFFLSTEELLKALDERKLKFDHEIILIKGARKFGFDELTEVVEKKVHETILEVNLGALVENFRYPCQHSHHEP